MKNGTFHSSSLTSLITPAGTANKPRAAISWPQFSYWPLLIVVFLKPVIDAFYEADAVKAVYMALLFSASVLASTGNVLGGLTVYPRNIGLALFAYSWFAVAYIFYLLIISVSMGGSLHEIFKIASPFFFFLLVAFKTGRWMAHALAASAVASILINAALLPTDYGWTMWGNAHTFKGYFFFKTDLAYALTFSVLIAAIYCRFELNKMLALLILIAGAQVFLANSRLNYLTFTLVLLFILFKSGISFKKLAGHGAILGILAIIVAATYSSTTQIGFNFEDIGAFTQGRDKTWGRLFASMANFSPGDWLVGRGLYADWLLAASSAERGQIHNAHNEFLHLIYNQGLVGLTLYVLFWLAAIRLTIKRGTASWLRGTIPFTFSLFALQSMTAVTSSYASKTWPVVMVLIMVEAMSRQDEATRARKHSEDEIK